MKVPIPIVAGLGALIIRLLGVSWRIDFPPESSVEEARFRHPQVIYCFWHGRLLPLSFTHRNRKIHVLASEHRDGEMLGRTIVRLGFGHVRGSSTRGGARALRELKRAVSAGYDLGLTVDGPKGPIHQVKAGAVELARSTGATLIPISTGSRRHRTFASWDRFQLPLPFTKVLVRLGEPIVVDANADKEAVESVRAELERALLRLTEQIDAEVRS